MMSDDKGDAQRQESAKPSHLSEAEAGKSDRADESGLYDSRTDAGTVSPPEPPNQRCGRRGAQSSPE